MRGSSTDIDQLLSQAQTAPTIQSARLKLQAAQRLTQRGNKERATQILNQIDTRALPPALAFDITHLRAQAALDEKHSERALEYLSQDRMPSAPMPTPDTLALNQLRADAYQQQEKPLAAARALIESDRLLENPDDIQRNHDAIWQQLLKVPTDQLQSSVQSATNTFDEQGWFELALIQRNSINLESTSGKSDRQEWQQRWKNHPAAQIPPNNLNYRNRIAAPQKIGRVGLLLPLSGPLSGPAQTISDGFYAALYAAQQRGQSVPAVVSLDSQKITTPEALFERAKALNLDLIIGPLNRDYVNRIAAQSKLPVPVLTLNRADKGQSEPFQLDLSSDQEARMVAEHAWSEGKRRVLTITPDAPWGKHLEQVMKDQFEALGGEVVDSLEYEANDSLSNQIAELLKTNDSIQRARQLRHVLRRSLETQEHPRSDADAILMTALPQDARQIKSMLAYHYAGDIPVYATSHVYTGTPNKVRDVDLDGIQFCDLPWVLLPPTEVHQALAQSKSNVDSRLGRLYALGADAFTIAPYLQSLSEQDGAFIKGETGTLTINKHNRVIRHLPWALFKNGTPEPLQTTSISRQGD